MNLKRTLGVVVASSILSACGGGGGSEGSGPPPSPTPAQYSVTTSVGSGGSVSPQSATVQSGATTTFTISADEGYQISSVEGCNGTLSGVSYTTGQISAGCEVTITFAPIGSSSADSQAPTASIIFPAPVTRTSSNTLIVRGTARDAGEVKSVRVNGVTATLTRSTPITLQSTKSIHRYAPDPMKDGTGSDAGGDSGVEVEWEVEVPVSSDGDSTVVVETEDGSGNVEQSADAIEIHNRAVPRVFTVDTVNRRLIGQVWQLPAEDGWYNPLVAWGLDDDSYEVLPTPLDYPNCNWLLFDASRNRVVCPQLFDGHLQLTALDIEQGVQSLLLGQNFQIDPAEWSHVRISDAKLSADYSSIYLMLVYSSAVSFDDSKAALLRYDFVSNSLHTIIDGYAQSGEKLGAESFALSGSSLIAIKSRIAGDILDSDELIQIDYEGESIVSLTEPFDLLLREIEVDDAANVAYMAGYYGIAKANLADGSKEVISLEAEEKEFNSRDVESLVHDASAGRLLIGDTAFDYIFSVDTETGERTEFAANGVGSGKHLLGIRAIELDEDTQRAYVVDDGGNFDGIVAAVDLNTGDRTVIARLDTCYQVAQDLVLDNLGGRLFVIFDHEIFQISLDDGIVSTLISSSGSCGSSYTFSGGSLDEAGNRLLLTETLTSAIMSLDLANNTLTSVYSGQELDVPVDVETELSSGLVYVLSQAAGTLHSYDPTSGETSLLLDTCVEDGGRNAMDPMVGGVHGMHLDPNNPWIWISGDYLMKYDLETDSCAVMPWKYYGYGLGNNISILDAEAAADGKLFGTKFNDVIQIDFESGEIVTISR